MIDAPPVAAGTAEDAFASQVTRELTGWDSETDDVLVCRLRNKVDKEKKMIHTLRGVGYVLKPA